MPSIIAVIISFLAAVQCLPSPPIPSRRFTAATTLLAGSILSLNPSIILSMFSSDNSSIAFWASSVIFAGSISSPVSSIATLHSTIFGANISFTFSEMLPANFSINSAFPSPKRVATASLTFSGERALSASFSFCLASSNFSLASA